MSVDNDWERIRNERLSIFGIGAVHFALLFGSAAVALALILVPIADNYSRPQLARNGMQGLDFTTTGSIGPSNTYTLRRSVLQASPDAVCIIRAGGERAGDC